MIDEVLFDALKRFSEGDAAAGDLVMTLAYPELKQMARNVLADERTSHTLQPTALVNEVWLKLNGERGMYESRARFFGLAARAMRQILVDYARRRLSKKRNAGKAPLLLDENFISTGGLSMPSMLSLDQSIDKLAEVDSRKARVVEMRFFAGMENDEIAHVLGVSERTIKRDWLFARAFLHELVYRDAT